jgi:hypothetical protein
MVWQYISGVKQACAQIKKEQFLAICILIIAAFGFLNALRFAGASVVYSAVRDNVSNWHSNIGIQDKEAFESVNLSIFTANLLHSSHPLYIDFAGQVDEWGEVSGFGQQNSLQKAEQHFQDAVKIRPLWPVSWANLAMIKWRLQEFDQQMFAYVMKAHELGSQSAEVHTLFALLGITLNNANHPMFNDIGDLSREHISRGLRNEQSKKLIVAFVQSTSSLSTVCRWVGLQDRETAEKHLPCP